MLHIHLFDQFQLCSGQQPLRIVSSRGQSLLAYLLLQRRKSHARAEIAYQFWPDTSDKQARANLRTELTRLRQTWAAFDEFVYDEQGTLQWRMDTPFHLDVMAFEEALQQAAAAEQAGDEGRILAHLQVAVAHYAGYLLPHLYDEWVLTARQQLSEQFLDALAELIGRLQQQHAYPQAIRYARQLLRYDPLHEGAYRCLMEMHLQNGDRANARRLYDACVTTLRRELDVAPSPLTQQCYHTLMKAA
jgi:DNA-binding SARP family transcriptional activator